MPVSIRWFLYGACLALACLGGTSLHAQDDDSQTLNLTIWIVRPPTSAEHTAQRMQQSLNEIKQYRESTAGNFGTSASDVGQTAGSYGKPASEFGRPASEVGQTAGSYGHGTAFCVRTGTWVPVQTSAPSGRTWIRQFTGSIGAWDRNGSS